MSTNTDDSQTVQDSDFYKEFVIERDEILRHKWIESEKVGYDVGFERALLEWVVRYRGRWLEHRRQERTSNTFSAPESDRRGTNVILGES